VGRRRAPLVVVAAIALVVGASVIPARPAGADQNQFEKCLNEFGDLWDMPGLTTGMSVQAAGRGDVTVTIPAGHPLVYTDAGIGQQTVQVTVPNQSSAISVPIPTKVFCEDPDGDPANPDEDIVFLVSTATTVSIPGNGNGFYHAALVWQGDGYSTYDGAGPFGALNAGATLSVPVLDSDADGFPDVSDRCPYEKGVAAFGGCPADPATRLDVVSLGDSYSSGEGAPPFDKATDTKGVDECHRSQNAWGPKFAQWDAAKLAEPLSLQFEACSGAVTPDLYGPNKDWGTLEPGQMLALTPDTDVVTLSIGGNDSGFVPVFSYCVAVDNCENQAVFGTDDGLGGDRLDRTYNAMFGTLVSVYGTIKARAPHATVYVMGYPDILPDTNPGTCPDVLGLDWAEIQWLHQKTAHLDAVIQAAARRAGVVYVDGSDLFKGHKLCSATPWASGLTAQVRGLVNWSVGKYAMHPNAAGYQAMTAAVERAPTTNPVPDATAVVGSTAEPVDLQQLGFANGFSQQLRDWDTQARNWTDHVKATLSGWLANSPLHIELHSSSPVSLGDFNADASGDAAVDFQLPASAAIGPHTVTITGTDSDGNPRVLVDDLYYSAADLVPTVTTTGHAAAGGNVAFAIGVADHGRGASVGAIAVDIAPDPDLTYGTPSGTGWSCATQADKHVRCTNTAAVGPGAALPVLEVTGAISAHPTAGVHTNAVQLTGGNDDYGSNNATVATWTIPAAPSPPSITQAPRPTLAVGGKLTSAGVPVTVMWSGTDGAGGGGITSYLLQRKEDGGAFATVALSPATATTITQNLAAGHTWQYRVQAKDKGGRTSALTLGAGFTPHLVQESAPGVAYSAGWTAQAVAGASGGSVKYSSASGKTSKYTFTGTQVAWVAVKASNRGSAAVSIDGGAATNVNTNSASTVPAVIAFAKVFATAGTHSMLIKNLATSGHPRVDLDAIVYLT
jgi:lysophospholipase L1-like esterase